jgi:hypothetical protein
MKKAVRLTHESQVRSNDVCTEHRDSWDGSAGANPSRLALDGYVTESTRLLTLRARAVDDRRAATEQCRRCRIALRAWGKAVVMIARLVTLPDTVMDILRIPGSLSDTALQAHMQALHDRVLPYKDAFVAMGLPPDVLPNLAGGIQTLADARAAYAATIQDAAAAEQALRENQARARITILALESIAPRETAEHREVVNKLKVARRVGPRTSDPANAVTGQES